MTLTNFVVTRAALSAVTVGLFAVTGGVVELLSGESGLLNLGVVGGVLYTAFMLAEEVRLFRQARRERREQVADIRARHAAGETISFYEAKVAGIEMFGKAK